MSLPVDIGTEGQVTPYVIKGKSNSSISIFFFTSSIVPRYAREKQMGVDSTKRARKRNKI